jgi:hypothetical protein
VKRNGNAHETQRRDTTLLLPCELKWFSSNIYSTSNQTHL